MQLFRPRKVDPDSKQLSLIQWVFVGITFFICALGAWRMTGEGWPSGCPDEPGRQILTNYLFQNNKLPVGDEPEIVIPAYGFSYALRPYLTSMLGAVFMKIIALIHESPHTMLFASRLCSVFSLTFCFLFCLRLGNKIYDSKASSILYAIMVCYLPQVMFLGMYQNNDMFSIMSVSVILYYLVSAFFDGWKIRNCIGLAVGLSIALLSYYSIYGWVMICGLAFVVSLFRNRNISPAQKMKRLSMIVAIILCLAGWFFIRNAVLHQGDFFGLATEDSSRKVMKEQGANLIQFNTPSKVEGMTVFKFLKDGEFQWFRSTIRSFIAVFGYMNLPIREELYICYYTFFVLGIVVYFIMLCRCRKTKEERALLGILISSSAITLFLSIYQSYYRDYQPQGRYIITAILPFAYMLAYGVDKMKNLVADEKTSGSAGLIGRKRINATINSAILFSTIWLLLFFTVLGETLSKMFTYL